MFKNLGLMFTLLSIPCIATAQGITTHKITDSIWMLEGRGGNIGVSVGVDGILIVDTQFANMADPILDAIKDIQQGEIDFIINTHFHGDHTGGNQALGQEASVIGHTNVRVRMRGRKDLEDATFRNSLPVLTYDNKATVHFNGEDIELQHYAMGHTDSDTVVYFPKANVLHLGDHFFVDRFPFIDEPSGGNVTNYLNNVRTLIDNMPKDATIIPGHGPVADIDDLKSFLSLLEESIAYIKKGMDAGKDRRTLQNEDLPSKWEEAGSGFVNTKRWIGIVHDSLSK